MSTALPRRFGSYLLIAPIEAAPGGRAFLARAVGEARLTAAPVVVTLHEGGLDDAALTRLRRRATVNSPHAPRITEVGHTFVVTEHVPGWTLDRALEAVPQRWPVVAAARVMCGLARALGRLGVLPDPERVHGGLALDQVLLSPSGRAYLLGLDAPSAPRGALGFAAPEQLAEAPLDPRADLYALGAIAWRLLTGTPWIAPGSAAAMRAAALEAEPRSLRALEPSIPARLDALVQTLLAPDRAARFASADELCEALVALVPGADQPDPDVSDRVGEALWSERESTRTTLARSAESMVAFHRPEDSFDEWGRPEPGLAHTRANAGRATPLGAVRRAGATVLKHPDEPGTPRTDPGAGRLIPAESAPEGGAIADEDTAPEAGAPPSMSARLRAPTFPGTWADGSHTPTPPVRGPTTDEVLANVRVVAPDPGERTRSLRGPAREGAATAPLVPSPARADAAAQVEVTTPRPWAGLLALAAAVIVLPLAGRALWSARTARDAERAANASPTPDASAASPSTGAVIAHVGGRADVEPARSSTAGAAAEADAARAPDAEARAADGDATASASPRATASASPRATASASPRATASASPRATASASPRATASASPRATASAPPATAAASPRADHATVERIADLLSRARAARSRLDARDRAEVERLIGALILEANAPDAPGVGARLDEHATALTRLEARPRP